MIATRIQKFYRLSLEEKILNGASVAAFVCVFFPWVGGEWLGGKTISYSGLGFFTSFIGLAILMLHLFILLVTIVPLTGGPEILSKRNRNGYRLIASGLASVLTIAVWSVLTKFTFEFSRLEIHFGLYVTLIGSLIATLYAFLLFQEGVRESAASPMHQTYEEHVEPPPPPTNEPEEYRSR